MTEQPRIEPGRWLALRTADGEVIERTAISGIQRGAKTMVVWICTEQERAAPPGPTRGRPWPLDAVERVLDTTAPR
ncbi:hypothetical protein ALI144C_22750 [Actinosynnema sp. ALI-1.44]|uniref:hypothetical protein n=1 Tax=Actinosynnema sp. ALI-1.44 TaxID=1933779 RepID=UPI00097C250B|nr:hypothetical protein [Actinosynnema sp. ALI-1.44]ONI79607.1 hypothetical protein ALI144C_22750 [Actinosynnema sp. ALI-1.44]